MNLNIKIIPQSQFITTLKNFSKGEVSLDFETNALKMWEIDIFQAFSFGLTTLNNPIDDIHYFSFGILTKEEIQVFKDFIFSRRVWVANAKFEGSIMWRMFGEMPLLDDIFSFFTALGYQGLVLQEDSGMTLKEGAQIVLGVANWADAPWGCVTALKAIMKFLRDKFKSNYEKGKSKNIRPLSYFLNEGNIKSALEWGHDTNNKLLEYERKLLLTIDEVKDYLRPVDIIRCILDTNYEKEKVNLTHVNQKIVVNYCGLDTVYTAQIANKLRPKVTEEQYQIYLKQTYLATVFEAYGAFWDLDKKEELKKYYLERLLYFYRILLSEKEFIFECEPGEIAKLDTYQTHTEIKKNIWNPNSNKKQVVNFFYDSLFTNSAFHRAMVAYHISVFTEKYDIFIPNPEDDTKTIHIKQLLKFDTLPESIKIVKKWFTDRVDSLKEDDFKEEPEEKRDLRLFAECVYKAKTIKSWYRDSLNEDMVNDMFHAMTQCGECDLDTPISEMNWAFRMVFCFKVIKKIEKSLNTYICGKSLGEGNLSNVTYDPENIMEVPLRTEKKDSVDNFFNLNFRSNIALSKRWVSKIHTIPPGSEIMELLIPRSERLIHVHFDASQAEVRVIGVIAGEQALIDAFEQGLDIHRFIASKIWRKDMKDVTKTERQYAKMAVFSILYGRTIESFAIVFLNGDLTEARAIFTEFFNRFPKIKLWVEKTHKDLLENGCVYTLFGDILKIPYNKRRKGDVDRALRQSQNLPVQSSSSSIIAVSIWELYTQLQQYQIEAIPNGFTHDSSDWEIATKSLIPFTRFTNINAVNNVKKKYGIPMKIDFEMGINKSHLIGVTDTEVTHNGYGINFNFESKETGFEENIKRLETEFKVDYEIIKTERVAESMSDLFFPKKAYSRYLGEKRDEYHGKMSLVLKQ